MDSDIEIVQQSASASVQDPVLVSEWQRLVESARSPNALYSSPEWVAHLAETDGRDVALWVVRDRGTLCGVLPIAVRPYQLSFDVSNREFGKVELPLRELLGSEPLLVGREDIYPRLFQQILDQSPDCQGLYFDALPADSPCSRFLHSANGSLDAAYMYSPFGYRPWHLVELSPTFENYLRSMSGKTRSTLRRKVRRLQDAGPLEMKRCSDPGEATEFLAHATRVSQGSWQHRLLGTRLNHDGASQRSFVDLAHRGILRSYLLRCGADPCAFVVGYQYRGVFHYAELGFDDRFAELSPGTALLFLIIEDLHAWNAPTLLNFGVGDASYKRRFGTFERRDESVLLLRKRVRNRLATRSHRAFNICLEGAKTVMGRRVHK